jgi:hypothetical protein
MNRKLAIAIAIAIACATVAGNAFADDITVDPHPFVSTMSRAQVQAELKAFRQSGVNPWADDYNQLAHFQSSMTRAQAKADFLASRDSVAAMGAEDSGSSYIARAKTPNQLRVARALAAAE